MNTIVEADPISLCELFYSNDPGSKRDIPGPRSSAITREETHMIGPGLQAVVQWAGISFARGEGPLLEDVDGNVYIDFMGGSGVNSIGHSHPRFVANVRDQVSRLMIGAFPSQARLEMLRSFQKILPPQLDRVQLYTGGTEAVEAALRLAKSYTGKFEFLGFWNGYHGKTLGSLGLTDGAKRGFGPTAPGNLAAPYAHCYHCDLSKTFPSCEFSCVEHVEKVIKHESVGALAGIIVEPIQGRLGNVTPPLGYLKALQKVAHDHDALLIVDETMTCMGRTGKMFAFEYDGIVPDIVIMGKGLGAGFPVTAIAASSKVMNSGAFAEPSASSSSFGGFPLACEALKTTIDVVLEENLPSRAAELGMEMLGALKEMERTIPLVGQVYGRGLMLGIELVADKARKTPASKEVLRGAFKELLSHGVLVMIGGNSLRLYPPLNIDRKVAFKGLDIIKKVLANYSSQLGLT